MNNYTFSVDGTPVAVFRDYYDAHRAAVRATAEQAALAFDADARFARREWTSEVHGPGGRLLTFCRFVNGKLLLGAAVKS